MRLYTCRWTVHTAQCTLKPTISHQNSCVCSQVKNLNPIDLNRLEFVGDALEQLRQEVDSDAAVLGFIGAPWTLATYIIEGGSSSYYKVIKSMMYGNPMLLETLLTFLADQIAIYAIYQVTKQGLQ